MLQGKSKGTSKKFKVYFKEVFKVFQRGSKEVSRVFQGRFRGSYFKMDGKVFKGSFKGVSREFQGYFNKI